MNKLDDLIRGKASAYFVGLGLADSLTQFKVEELMLCVERGYNTRAEILGLLKKIGA